MTKICVTMTVSDYQLDLAKFITLAASLGYDRAKRIPYRRSMIVMDYLHRHPNERYSNGIKPQHLATLYRNCNRKSNDPVLEALREADRHYFALAVIYKGISD